VTSLPFPASATCADEERAPAACDAGTLRLEFADVYTAHFDFVWRSVRHLGVPPSALDDAVQDVWLVVHRRLPEFQGRSSVSTWLFGIALNIVRSRRRRREIIAGAAPLPEELESPAPDPERRVAGNDAWRLVQQFLEELSELSRAVFVSALLENLTPAETAEAIGVDVETIYKQVRALRRSFQRRLSRLQE
jgi:RNA polymerase sigma-70 factor (ECF subfamily)